MSTNPKKKKKYQVIARTTLKGVKTSPQKARLIVDLIKGKEVEVALQILKVNARKAAGQTEKLLQTAIADARENYGADVDRLLVTGGWVNQGTTMKRFMPRAHGRATTIRKRTAHIVIEVGTYAKA